MTIKFVTICLLIEFSLTSCALTTFGKSSFPGRSLADVERDDINCVPDLNDNKTCTFSDIMDSFKFHYYLLNNLNDSKASDIKTVKFINSFMDNIPKELSMLFKAAEELDASNVNLERFESYDFTSGNNFKVVNVSNNKLNKLGFQFTLHLKKLEVLDMSHNLIERINPYALIYIQNFKVFNLSHNRISKLDEHFFTELRSLKILHLDHNLIEEIAELSYMVFHFNNLNELYLQNNKLKTLSANIIKPVKKLDVSLNLIKKIDIKRTQIIELKASDNELTLLEINDNLEFLDASGSESSMIHINFGDNKVLKHLDLSNLQLSTPQKDFERITKIESLEYLDISNIPILITEKSFIKLRNLQTLILVGCIKSAVSLPFNAFKGLINLTYLDLSENNIIKFDFVQLKNSPNLKVLKFYDNFIYKFVNWKNVTNILPQLNEVHLHSNLLNCHELEEIEEEFMRLNITIPEIDLIGQSEFDIENCVDEDRYYELVEGKQKAKSFFVYLIVTVLIVLSILGIIVINKKFDIFNKITKWTHKSPKVPRSASLLREEMENN